MNGRNHIIYGMTSLFIIWILMVIYSFMDVNFVFPQFLAYGAGGILGCLFPDFDFIFGDGSAKYHRSTITHSSIIPLIATLSYLYSPDYGLALLLLFTNLGMATHLWLDMIFNNVPDEYKHSLYSRWQYRIKMMKLKRVGGILKGPFATRKKKGRWLFLNGLICVFLAIILFLKILYRIDFNWWFR